MKGKKQVINSYLSEIKERNEWGKYLGKWSEREGKLREKGKDENMKLWEGMKENI